MASWTDSTPQTYTPYTSPWDTELYARAIAYKQGEHDKNVTKIQSNLDVIGGLDIMNGTQKAYLQGKLQNQVSQLNSMSGADWSDGNLLAQVGGMAASITSDKVVQNGIASTLKARKSISDMENAKKEGKSSPENEWDLQNQINNYANNTDVSASFNGGYTQYRDVRKKAVEALKALNPTITERDIAFNADGSLADAMVREKLKGISPQQIKGALFSYLDGGDMKQLEISGRYSYSNTNPQQFAAILSSNNQKYVANIDDKIKVLSARKDGLKDGAAISSLSAQIASLQQEKKESIGSHEKELAQIAEGNVESAKANHYASQFLNSFSNAFSFTETSQTYETNPMAQMAMERIKIKQAADQYAASYEQRERFEAQTNMFKAAELAEKQKENAANAPLGGVLQPVETSALPDVNVSTYMEGAKSLESSINREENSFVEKYGDTSNPKWLSEQRALYDAGKEVKPSIANYFRTRELQEQDLHTRQQLVTNLSKEADRQIGTGEAEMANLPGLSFYRNGREFHFDPKEIIKFQNKYESLSLEDKKALESGDQDLLDSSKNLSSKEKIFYENLRALDRKAVKVGKAEAYFTDSDNTILSTYNQYKKTSRNLADLQKRKTEWINKQLADKTGESQRLSYDIPTGNSDERTAARRVVNDLAARADDMGESFGTGTKRAEYDKIKKMNDDDNTTYSLVSKGKTEFSEAKYWLRLNKDDNEYQDIPLSPEDKMSIFGNRYESASPENTSSPMKQHLNMVGNGTSNFNGVKNPTSASVSSYYNRSSFSNVRNFSVKGDVVEQNGRYSLVMYVYDPIKQQMVSTEYAPSSNLMSESEVNAAVNGMSDGAIYKLLYGKAPSETELKEIENLNKK